MVSCHLLTSHLPCLTYIEKMKAAINIQNVDIKCFLRNVLAGLYLQGRIHQMVMHYVRYQHVLHSQSNKYLVQSAVINHVKVLDH